MELSVLMADAARLRDRGHGRLISYSRKVFIPLTQLCRDVCHYCTFAETPPRRAARLPVARRGAGDRARRRGGGLHARRCSRWATSRSCATRAAREALARARLRDDASSYLAAMCELVLRETGLLPHVNPGVMTREEIAALRECRVSQGIMLESAAERLCEQGGVHFGSPDKRPAVRLETHAARGRAEVPFTTGILIGIGETREERIEALLAIARPARALRPHPGNHRPELPRQARHEDGADAASPTSTTCCGRSPLARLIFGPEMNIQAPPNLTPGAYRALIAAGINDWGGVSPVTPDHVNPEAPWPELEALRARTPRAPARCWSSGSPSIRATCRDAGTWLDARAGARACCGPSDAEGFARDR